MRNLKPGLRLSLVHWLPAVLWAGLIFAFSAQPDLRFAQADNIDFIVRKAGHMFVFGVLAVLLWRALAHAQIRRAMAWSWLWTAAYAASDEFHQSFTQGRHASPADVAIDCTGALIATCFLVVWLRQRGARVRSADGD